MTPTDAGPSNLTVLLERHRAGDASAMDAVWPIVYSELKRIAQRQIGGEGAMTLSPTDLLHEACIRLFGADVPIESRRHLFALAARVMRNVLVDHARAKRSLKRGEGKANVTLTGELLGDDRAPVDVLALEQALEKLAAIDVRKREMLELHVYGGLKYDELAHVLGVSEATVHRDLRFAKAWVAKELVA
jgi:RNA polymerase sigma factor (TIGR02999 family)